MWHIVDNKFHENAYIVSSCKKQNHGHIDIICHKTICPYEIKTVG
jgi:hypothetical protein